MKFLLSISIFTLFVSCSSQNSKQATQDSVPQQKIVLPELKKGDFTDLTVASDPENSYTVYLPTNYSTTKKYPLIVFFDAHADGKLPLTKYKSIAEKWGFIFLASNTSKNGMELDMTAKIGNVLVDEAKAILSVDSNTILLCGFSGGSRVAAYIASGRPDVKGVICNSAAPQAPMPGKVFVGLAGLGDMNYLEMKKFIDVQPTNTSPHELLVFDGKHEWAPANMMEDAMLIATIYNNKNNQEKYAKLEALETNTIIQTDSIKKTSCLLAKNMLETFVSTLQHSQEKDTLNRKISTAERKLSALSKDPCVKSDEAAWKKAEDEETGLQQELGTAIMQQDTTWWKENADKYFETKNGGAEKFMRERLRGYASLMCYSYINQANQTDNLHAAEKLIKVYSIVDPTNSEWAYMQAALYMKINLPDYAMASLGKAVDLGFNDRTRLLSDANFTSMQTDARFSEAISKMK